MESKSEKYIPINIWDDFYDDGHVPEGEKQETYIYVEDREIPHEKTKEYLEILMSFIQESFNTEGIMMWMEYYDSRKKYPNLVGNPDAEGMFFERWEIKLEGLTHEKLNEWMEIFDIIEIKVDDIPFHIYSES